MNKVKQHCVITKTKTGNTEVNKILKQKGNTEVGLSVSPSWTVYSKLVYYIFYKNYIQVKNKVKEMKLSIPESTPGAKILNNIQ